jgi:hypothetical protein
MSGAAPWSGKVLKGSSVDSLREYLQNVREVKATRFEVQWNPATVAIDRETAIRSLRRVSRDGATFTFAANEPVVERIRPGSILWVRDLALRKVDAVGTEGGFIQVHTQAVSLNEALPNAVIEFQAAVPVQNFLLSRPDILAPLKTAKLRSWPSSRGAFMPVVYTIPAALAQVGPAGGSSAPPGTGGPTNNSPSPGAPGGPGGSAPNGPSGTAPVNTSPGNSSGPAGSTENGGPGSSGPAGNSLGSQGSGAGGTPSSPGGTSPLPGGPGAGAANGSGSGAQNEPTSPGSGNGPPNNPSNNPDANSPSSPGNATSPSAEGPTQSISQSSPGPAAGTPAPRVPASGTSPPVPPQDASTAEDASADGEEEESFHGNSYSGNLNGMDYSLGYAPSSDGSLALSLQSRVAVGGGGGSNLFSIVDDNLDIRFKVDAQLSGFGASGLYQVVNGDLTQAQLQFKNLKGHVSAAFVGRLGQPGNKDVKIPIMHLPISFNVPLPVEGIPFVLQIGGDFLLTVFLAGNHASLAVNGQYDFDGTSGFSYAKASGNMSDSSSLTGKDPTITSYQGASLGASAVVLAVQLPRVGFGLGVNGIGSTVAYFDVIHVFTMTQSADAAAALGFSCKRVTYNATGHVGIATNIVPLPIEAVRQWASDKVNGKREVFNYMKVVTDPAIKACEI